MNVHAKFKCVGIHHLHCGSPDAVAVEVRLVPVWEENGKNREWSKATPSGELKMLITNPPAAAAFELGRDYLLTFAPVEFSAG